MESLFTRLASYGQNPQKQSIENFTTELLAYLVNEDNVFRRVFVKYVLDRRRISRRFRHAKALTQQAFPRGVVDLVLADGRGQKALIEVKLRAAETLTRIDGRGYQPQIRKYLSYRQGPVAYLTTMDIPYPDVSGSKGFLGQYYFEELYRRTSGRRLSTLGKLFIKFLEERDMIPPNITAHDIRRAQAAFKFGRRCEKVLDQVGTQLEPHFRKVFRTRTSFTPGCFSPTYGSAFTHTVKFQRGPIKRVEFILEPEGRKLYFSTYLRTVQDRRVGRLRRQLRWEGDSKGLWSSMLLQGDGRDLGRMVSHATKSITQLRRGVREAGL